MYWKILNFLQCAIQYHMLGNMPTQWKLYALSSRAGLLATSLSSMQLELLFITDITFLCGWVSCSVCFVLICLWCTMMQNKITNNSPNASTQTKNVKRRYRYLCLHVRGKRKSCKKKITACEVVKYFKALFIYINDIFILCLCPLRWKYQFSNSKVFHCNKTSTVKMLNEL